ncbi:hypothetical protein [Amycolatopsis sp. Poz14]|uniref:hypothetical protein n=1 Tax=Amycolatopsis sp. Poz14 TaxID=1447705 RepID=UPI001EE8DDE7|nr:hypothetical protein [Amycolatopsis sp. Poz14]MCG3751966.1 hypothetical protein [Amycolatopsis sp. Poz14]
MTKNERWQDMQDAIARARQHPAAIIQAVSSCSSRGDAAAALMPLLKIDRDLADQLLDLHVSDFIGQPG